MRLPTLTPGVWMLFVTLVPGALAVAFFLHAALPETVELDWQFSAGQPFYEETATSVRARGAADQFQHRTYVVRWLPVEQTAAGEWVIERRLERVRVESEAGGHRLSIYDSARPDENSAVFERFYQGLVGWQSTVLLTPNLRLSRLTVPAAPAADRLAADAADFCREETQREMIEALLIWMQPRRLRAGVPCIVERSGRAALGEGTLRHTLRYERRAGALDQVRWVMDAEPPGRPAASNVRFAQGVAWFDRQQRRLNRVELYLDPRGTVTVLASGGAAGYYPSRRITRILDALPEGLP